MDFYQTKILFLNRHYLNDDKCYLNGISPDLGWASFLNNKKARKEGQYNLTTNQLVKASVEIKNNNYKLKEVEVVYSFPTLLKSPEAQLSTNSLALIARDWLKEQDIGIEKNVYQTLVYSFYKIESIVKEDNYNIYDLIQVIILTELRFLCSAGYLQRADENFIKDLVYGEGWLNLFQHIQNATEDKLYTCQISKNLFFQATSVIERYMKEIMGKKNNHLEPLFDLLKFEEESKNIMRSRLNKDR